MKTPKVNLSKDSLKDFFFRHTEKLLFGLSVALVGLFIYMGFSTPAFDVTTPDGLLAKAKQAGSYIEDPQAWNEIEEYRQPVTDAAERIAAAEEIDGDQVVFREIMSTGIATREKRTDPAFLQPEGFRTKQFVAQVAIQPKSGNSRKSALDRLPVSALVYPPQQRSESFVMRPSSLKGKELAKVNVVAGLALIDYEAQLEAYRETFRYQRAYDPNRDLPQYAFVEVQRKTESSDWEPITAGIHKDYEHFDGTFAQDIVDPIAKANSSLNNLSLPTGAVTMEIPPLLGMDYRDFVTLNQIKIFDPDDFVNEEDEADDASSDQPEDGGSLFGGGGNRDDEAEETMAKDDEKDAEEEVPQYRLIRFFDLAPKRDGEKYYYRIRLWYMDPNDPRNFDKDAKAAGGGDSDSPQLGAGGRGGGGGAGLDDAGGATGGGKGGSGGDVPESLKFKSVPLPRDDISPDVRRRLLEPAPEVKGLPGQYSDPDLLARLVPGEWVEAEEPVTINSRFETFVAGPVEASSPVRIGNIEFFDREPEATVLVNSFQEDLKTFVPAETTIPIASVLDFEAVTYVHHPITNEIKELFESEDSRGRKTGRKFETEAVLVDIVGGQRQPFSRSPDSFTVPSEVILLDRNGKLIVRDELLDEREYRHSRFYSVDNEEARAEAADTRKNDDEDDDSGRGPQ